MFVAERADGAFDREVLITFLRTDASQPEARRRFDKEVELQARLDHPGFAKVYGAGSTEAGVRYLVTEYLPGADIEAHLDGQRANLRERIPYLLLVCDAVQHAHDKGIVGLHLQAENVHIMPDESVRLVVYGLAQSNDGVSETPPWPEFAIDYASPEEWRGKPVTQASDVYSLGVLLFRLLTGLLPKTLTGLTPAEAGERANREWSDRASTRVRNRGTDRAAEQRATDLRGLSKALSGDLDRILDRALAHDPAARYASPRALAEDLQRHLDGQPIKARGPAPFYALRRRLVRHRLPITVSALVVGSLVWAVGTSLLSANRAQAAWREAQEAEQGAAYQSRRLQELCVRFLTELGPSMQGRQGLEDARRYLLNAGAPLLDHLRAAGREDRRLHRHLADSYLQLAEADWIARDQLSSTTWPDSVDKARRFARSYVEDTPAGVPPDGLIPWARSIRCGIWFANLSLDERAGRRLLAEAEAELAGLALTEEDLPALAVLVLMEARRTWNARALRFEEALRHWDRNKIEAMERRDPNLAPFLQGDRPRFDSYRARYLVRSGKVREALLVLPPIVYLIQEEATRHSPPLLDLLTLEADAWLLLAIARAYSGVPTGEALVQARQAIATIQERYGSDSGSAEVLAISQRWLAECLWVMGREHWAEADQVCDRAIERWQSILRGPSRWPYYSAELARTHALRARIARDRGDRSLALRSLLEAQRLLQDLHAPADQHPYALWIRADVALAQKALDPDGEAPSWDQVAAALDAVRAAGIDPYPLEALESEWRRLVANHGPDELRIDPEGDE